MPSSVPHSSILTLKRFIETLGFVTSFCQNLRQETQAKRQRKYEKVPNDTSDQRHAYCLSLLLAKVPYLLLLKCEPRNLLKTEVLRNSISTWDCWLPLRPF